MRKNLHSWLILALVLAFTTGLIGQANAAATTANPVVGKTVKSITVKGNNLVSQEEILKVVETKPGDKLAAEKLQKDLQNIYNLGYFYDVAANPTAVAKSKDGVNVVYEVIENPIVKNIKINGNTKYSSEELAKLLTTQPNKILNSRQLNEDLAKVEKKYHDEGYVLSKVKDVAMDLDGTLNITLSEGLIEDIAASGNKKTKDYVITRNFSKAMLGQPFNINQVRQGMQKVYNLGYFEDVSMHLDPGSQPDKNKLVVDVKEGKTGTATFGAGYSSDDGMSAFIQVGENNFRGRGRQVKLRWQFGGTTDYGISYFDPWVDDKQTSFGFNLYNELHDRDRRDNDGNIQDSYEERSKGASVTLGRPTGEYTRTSLTLGTKDTSAEWESGANGRTADMFFNGDGTYKGYQGGTTNSAAIGIVKDTRDNWLDPKSGYRHELDVELGGHTLGGDYDYTKYQADLRKYIKSGKKNSWAFRAFAGTASGNLPDSELFDVGGADTLRGYDDSQFEGKKALTLSAEYRIPFGSKMQGVIFADAGKAWDNDRDPTVTTESLKVGKGIGLRFTTPLGPLRLDFARGDQGSKVHFSIGQAF